MRIKTLTEARPAVCFPTLPDLSGECRRSIEPLMSIGARRSGSSLLAFSARLHSRLTAGFDLDRPHLGILEVAAVREAVAAEAGCWVPSKQPEPSRPRMILSLFRYAPRNPFDETTTWECLH